MFRLITGGFVLALLALTAAPISADDKDKTTTWMRESNGIELKFEFTKDTAKFHVSAGDNSITASAKIKIEKDVVTAEITDVETKGDIQDAPKKGDKVSFKWVVKGDTATLSDLKGDNVDNAKAIVEGEYKKKK
jgi:hypothetical protein